MPYLPAPPSRFQCQGAPSNQHPRRKQRGGLSLAASCTVALLLDTEHLLLLDAWFREVLQHIGKEYVSERYFLEVGKNLEGLWLG